MTFDALHVALMNLAVAIMAGIGVKVFTGSRCVTHEELESVRTDMIKRCESQHAVCGVHSLVQKIDALTDLIRLLCEKSGISVETQIEIEKQKTSTGRYQR